MVHPVSIQKQLSLSLVICSAALWCIRVRNLHRPFSKTHVCIYKDLYLQLYLKTMRVFMSYILRLKYVHVFAGRFECIHIYIYVVHTYIYIYTHVYNIIQIQFRISSANIRSLQNLCDDVNTYMDICVYLYTYICIYIYIYSYAHIYIHINTCIYFSLVWGLLNFASV